MDLVEDHERTARHRTSPVHRGRHSDLGVGHDGAVKVASGVHVGVAEAAIELDADLAGG